MAVGLLSLCCVLAFARRSHSSPSGARARGRRLGSVLHRLLGVLGFDGAARRAAAAPFRAIGRRPPRPALPCPRSGRGWPGDAGMGGFFPRSARRRAIQGVSSPAMSGRGLAGLPLWAGLCSDPARGHGQERCDRSAATSVGPCDDHSSLEAAALLRIAVATEISL